MEKEIIKYTSQIYSAISALIDKCKHSVLHKVNNEMVLLYWNIGKYIVDFYCAKAKLVIELDGGGHYTDEQMQSDEFRTKYLNNMGLKVLRICNIDIDNIFYNVCEHIDRVVKQSLPQSASQTAPSSEGAE